MMFHKRKYYEIHIGFQDEVIKGLKEKFKVIEEQNKFLEDFNEKILEENYELRRRLAGSRRISEDLMTGRIQVLDKNLTSPGE